jgi:molecular chaperone DnaJ
MQGKGNANDAGNNFGDLIVKVSVKEDPYFKRDGYDILTDAHLTIA